MAILFLCLIIFFLHCLSVSAGDRAEEGDRNVAIAENDPLLYD
jgi:hypothetical protein